MMGGKEAASPRYIYTNIDKLTRLVFHKDDDMLLNYLREEGQKIEPDYYAPIIPLCLVNGAEGIGTGWSTSIPCFSPIDICANLRRRLNDRSAPFKRMVPWYRGFIGTFHPKDETMTAYTVKGCSHKQGDTLTITELPVLTWTRNYKNHLEDLA